jgi:hypothetical protein
MITFCPCWDVSILANVFFTDIVEVDVCPATTVTMSYFIEAMPAALPKIALSAPADEVEAVVEDVFAVVVCAALVVDAFVVAENCAVVADCVVAAVEQPANVTTVNTSMITIAVNLKCLFIEFKTLLFILNSLL